MKDHFDEQGLLDSEGNGVEAFASASLWVALGAGVLLLIIALYAALQSMGTVALWLAVTGALWCTGIGTAMHFRKRR